MRPYTDYPSDSEIRARTEALAGAIMRVDDLLLAALMAEEDNEELYDTMLGRARAVADEWNFPLELRVSLREGAESRLRMAQEKGEW